MKVFLIILDDNNDYSAILGCYSSKEKALESAPYHERLFDESDIVELEVDPPKGEAYIEGWGVSALTDGSFVSRNNWRLLPSEVAASVPKLNWNEMSCRGSALAFGATEEEAKAKAIEGLKLLAPVWQVGRAKGSNRMIEIQHPTPAYVHKWEQFYAVHKDLETARQMVLDHEAKNL